MMKMEWKGYRLRKIQVTVAGFKDGRSPRIKQCGFRVDMGYHKERNSLESLDDFSPMSPISNF